MSFFSNIRRVLASLVLFFFTLNSFGPLPSASAQLANLPSMVALSPSFSPAILKGIKVNPDNPFQFEFILDKGNSDFSGQQLENESSRLIKYFLAAITVPEKDLWVNLSPYEKDRIVPDSFGQTEMGRDLLAQDYLLKQITSSLMFPDSETGKKFWEKIRSEAMKQFGTAEIPVDMFNKVWIVPEKAVVYEHFEEVPTPSSKDSGSGSRPSETSVGTGTAYVVETRLKVMLEEDYVALARHSERSEESQKTDPSSLKNAPQDDAQQLNTEIIREIIIPELTREINEGQNFAQLRQVYNSLILATWYKKKIKDSILNQVYADQNKVVGVEYVNSVIARSEATKQSQDDEIASPSARNDKELIYEQYLEAFKQGAYDYIKDEYDPATQSVIPRKYFSGGVEFGSALDLAMIVTAQPPFLNPSADMAMVSVDVKPAPNQANATLMNGSNQIDRKKVTDKDLQFYSFSEMRDPALKLEVKEFVTNWWKVFNFSSLEIDYSWKGIEQGREDIIVTYLPEYSAEKPVATFNFLINPANRKYVTESGIYVDKEYQGRGIGSALLEKAIAVFKNRGYSILRIGGDKKVTVAGEEYLPTGLDKNEAIQSLAAGLIRRAQANNALIKVTRYKDDQKISSLSVDLKEYQINPIQPAVAASLPQRETLKGRSPDGPDQAMGANTTDSEILHKFQEYLNNIQTIDATDTFKVRNVKGGILRYIWNKPKPERSKIAAQFIDLLLTSSTNEERTKFVRQNNLELITVIAGYYARVDPDTAYKIIVSFAEAILKGDITYSDMPFIYKKYRYWGFMIKGYKDFKYVVDKLEQSRAKGNEAAIYALGKIALGNFDAVSNPLEAIEFNVNAGDYFAKQYFLEHVSRFPALPRAQEIVKADAIIQQIMQSRNDKANQPWYKDRDFSEFIFELAGKAVNERKSLAQLLRVYYHWSNLNIFRPLFWNKELRENLVNNRLDNESAAPSTNRPLAIVITPKSDWNNSFMREDDLLVELTERYKVLYYEVSSAQEMIVAIKNATKHQQASMVMIGGHGSPATIKFEEGEYLTLEHKRMLAEADLEHILKPGAKGILQSCSTGGCSGADENIADMLANAFQRDFFAPKEDTSIEELAFDDPTNFVSGVTYTTKEGTNITYQSSPKDSKPDDNSEVSEPPADGAMLGNIFKVTSANRLNFGHELTSFAQRRFEAKLTDRPRAIWLHQYASGLWTFDLRLEKRKGSQAPARIIVEVALGYDAPIAHKFAASPLIQTILLPAVKFLNDSYKDDVNDETLLNAVQKILDAVKAEHPASGTIDRAMNTEGVNAVMTDRQMRDIIYQYLIIKQRDPSNKDALDVRWLGQGTQTKVIGYKTNAYRWRKDAGSSNYAEEKNYQLLGNELDISPRLIDSGTVYDQLNHGHSVIEVEQVLGKSLDQLISPLIDQEFQYIKDLLDRLINERIFINDFYPENIAIGYIHREGKDLAPRAYPVDVEMAEQNKQWSARELINLYLSRLQNFYWRDWGQGNGENQKDELIQYLKNKIGLEDNQLSTKSSVENDGAMAVPGGIDFKGEKTRADRAMLIPEMQQIVFLFEKDRRPVDQDNLEVDWVGEGMTTSIIGYKDAVYRWIKEANDDRLSEREAYGLLGDQLNLSPHMIDGDWVEDEFHQKHYVLKVERVYGDSLDKWSQPATRAELTYVEDLFGQLIDSRIIISDPKPQNFAIGYIRRNGRLLALRAYPSDLGEAHQYLSLSKVEIARSYLKNLIFWRRFQKWDKFDPKNELALYLENKIKQLERDQALGVDSEEAVRADGAMNARKIKSGIVFSHELTPSQIEGIKDSSDPIMIVDPKETQTKLAETPESLHSVVTSGIVDGSKKVYWRIFETPFSKVNSDSIAVFNQNSSWSRYLGGQFFPAKKKALDGLWERIRMSALTKREKGEILYILDWGAGNLTAVRELSARLESAGLNNVQIVAFGDTYFSQVQPLPDNVLFIVDYARNLPSVIKEQLPDVKLDIIYGYESLHFFLMRGPAEFLDYIATLQPLMSVNGFIVCYGNIIAEALNKLGSLGRFIFTRNLKKLFGKVVLLSSSEGHPEKGYLLLENPTSNDKAQLGESPMDEVTRTKEVGGIDFTAEKTPLEIKTDSSPSAQNDNVGIKFTIDPAQLEQLRNAPGFVPVIINIQPMTNLPMWLGLNKKENQNQIGML